MIKTRWALVDNKTGEIISIEEFEGMHFPPAKPGYRAVRVRDTDSFEVGDRFGLDPMGEFLIKKYPFKDFINPLKKRPHNPYENLAQRRRDFIRHLWIAGAAVATGVAAGFYFL